jgi:hypothetical protein
MPHGKLHAGLAQALQPGAQQRRGLHVLGKHAARAADKGFHAQGFGPGAQLGGAEGGQQRLQLRGALAITADKNLRRLGMREIEPAYAGQQELAACRGHGVIHLHPHGRAGAGQGFGGHQAGGPAAYDGHTQCGGGC